MARALFLREKSISVLLFQQSETEKMLRKASVLKNRTIVERIVEVVSFLRRQPLSFWGHREALCSETMNNRSNFLETLDLLSKNDAHLKNHFNEVRLKQEMDNEKGKNRSWL